MYYYAVKRSQTLSKMTAFLRQTRIWGLTLEQGGLCLPAVREAAGWSMDNSVCVSAGQPPFPGPSLGAKPPASFPGLASLNSPPGCSARRGFSLPRVTDGKLKPGQGSECREAPWLVPDGARTPNRSV